MEVSRLDSLLFFVASSLQCFDVEGDPSSIDGQRHQKERLLITSGHSVKEMGHLEVGRGMHLASQRCHVGAASSISDNPLHSFFEK